MGIRGVVGLCSHLPVLATCIANTLGDVLELGAGVYSTPVIHWLCAMTDRNVLTLDSDPEWIAMLAHYRTPAHKIEHSPEPFRDSRITDRPWGLAFVDGAANERGPCLERLHQPRFVVVHDTEPRHLNQYAGFAVALAKYKYKLDVQFPMFSNQTSILSDVEDPAITFRRAIT